MSTLPILPADTVDLAAAKPTQSTVTVTTDTATRWLEHNTRNRPLSAVVVERYRRDMEAGRWMYAADPIRFSTSGVLLDGQHRLTAHSMVPGLSLPYLVVRGLADDTQFFMDQGRKRTAGQQLAIKGVKNAQNIASGVKVYIAWREGLMFRDNKLSAFITAPQIEEWVEAHEDRCLFVSTFVNAIRATDAPPSVGVAVALRLAEIDPVMSAEFFQSIADGRHGGHHPINTLDNRLRRIRKNHVSTSTRDYVAFFVLAWNAWREGREMTKFQRPRGGSWTAENFPEPK